MTTHRLKLALIFTSVLTLAACSEEETNKDVTMVDKEKQMDTKAESMPKELVAEPVTQAEAIEENVKGEVSMKGSIIYKDLEGGFYAFIAENGDRYTLHGLDETYQKNGLVVEVKGTPKPDMMTFTQFGTVLQVSSVKVLDTSKVIDNLQTK
ncbi:ribose-phosphate pyrophosphokinase [Alteromonas sp. PRIM-21]|uniref:ribose-phosphate pyrophosphokinase n=1 Tax=Alteromonas sp. PRIM-21 TaxID=1454978 RepID=UPI0022B95D64|nr:ribose-phosphate pyrophosphokinase [Alteromonas sp. PRIM-21]MCZ8528319.1 ribose-phosphate pyrophosphokinase [Alteromonas sp. PRIM-21]